MADKTRVQVKGLRELGENLRALGEDVANRIGRAAMFAGSKIVKEQAIRNAENINRGGADATGLLSHGHYLADNIIVRRQRQKTIGRLTTQYAVTVRHKGKIVPALRKDQTNPYGVGIFNEFGTVKMSAWPFMRPAFDSTKQAALDAVVERLKKRIDKANKVKK